MPSSLHTLACRMDVTWITCEIGLCCDFISQLYGLSPPCYSLRGDHWLEPTTTSRCDSGADAARVRRMMGRRGTLTSRRSIYIGRGGKRVGGRLKEDS